MLAVGQDGGLLSKGQSPSLTVNGVTEPFIDRGRGLHAETVWSALTVILTLVTDGLTSLVVSGTVNLQFQAPFVPISLGQVSELWQLMSWAQSDHQTTGVVSI